jgi:hypothetical protein
MTSRVVREDLARTVEEHPGRYGAPAHLRVLDLCAEAVAFGREAGADADPARARMRATAAAHLMLELICPFLSGRALCDLSVACGRAAVQLP